jgi:CubicO group peptidase (beta-lactamase class C family)
MFTRSIITPLGMTGTSYNLPLSSSLGVIPSTSPATTWGLSGGDFNPAGGFYSTPSDLARLGRSILTSHLIPSAMTRRWMKPLTHTADLRISVGAPWEIERLTLSPPQEKVVDLYGKSGDLGTYHASYALIPDWQIGYSVNIADVPNVPSMANDVIGEMINELVLPLIEETARREADENFAGRYRACDGTLNSSLVLTTSNVSLGLGVKEWISNSTDMFVTFGKLRKIPAKNVSITLYPTGLTDRVGGGRKQAWRAAVENNGAPVGKGLLACISWFLVDGPIHGGLSGDEFAFEVDENGKATSVEARALRVSMERVE